MFCKDVIKYTAPLAKLTCARRTAREKLTSQLAMYIEGHDHGWIACTNIMEVQRR